jgi:hypothetical protein
MAATQYSNERAIKRRELESLGLQDTQRSWSNYVGDKPIERWIGEQPVSAEARGYADSPRWGANVKTNIAGGAFESGAAAAAAQQEAAQAKTPKEEDNSLPKGFSRREGDPEGQWRNRYGNLEPEEWYTQDPETKSWKKKTEKEYRDFKKINQAPSYISSNYGSAYTQPPPFPENNYQMPPLRFPYAVY